MSISRFSPRKNNNTHLYTKGGEFSLNGKNYVGEYHYEGTQPKTGPIQTQESQKLTRYYSLNDHYIYDKAFRFNIKILTYINPKPYLYKPKDQAYFGGYDLRYFVEKIDDENSYAVEIDSIQYQSIGKSGGIDGGLYLSTTMNWKITGRQQDIAKHNELEIQKASIKLPTIAYCVKNYLEHARVTAV